MLPVQDLTIEDRVSRTQYQFTMETADPDELSLWNGRLVERLSRLPQLADVASDLQDRGLQAYVDLDRDAAGRLGLEDGDLCLLVAGPDRSYLWILSREPSPPAAVIERLTRKAAELGFGTRALVYVQHSR